MDSIIFKIFNGLIALITLVSGIVTIVVGYDQTLKFVVGLTSKQSIESNVPPQKGRANIDRKKGSR